MTLSLYQELYEKLAKEELIRRLLERDKKEIILAHNLDNMKFSRFTTITSEDWQRLLDLIFTNNPKK